MSDTPPFPIRPKALDHKLRELTALSKIGEALAAPLELDAVAHRVMEILHSVMGMQRGTLALIEPETGDIVIKVALGLSKGEQEKGRYRPGEGIIGRIVAENRPIMVPNVGREPGFLDRTGARTRLAKEDMAFIGVPVKFKGRMLGAITADRLFDDRELDLEEDIRLLTVVASLVGQSVELHHVFEREREALKAQADNLERQLKRPVRLDRVIGDSGAMVQVYEAVQQVAASRATVLLRGESGTGKELIARAIHANSPRAAGAFIPLNCSALPETLLESELFGHEKGAYTGAVTAKKGRFEQADGGTLFLDEIGDISPATQVKLLRVLQDLSFERLGGTHTVRVDVRVVVATHRNLEQMVGRGEFREDLYYRLNVIPIMLPPLRERREDIPLLAEHFRQRLVRENSRDVTFSDEAVWVLMRHDWPGNVRELENLVERLVVMSPPGELPGRAVTRLLNRTPPTSPETGRRSPPQDSPPGIPPAPAHHRGGQGLKHDMEAVEREQLLVALDRCGWVQARAARLLGITPRMVAYRIKKFDLKPLR